LEVIKNTDSFDKIQEMEGTKESKDQTCTERTKSKKSQEK
jgi:hypothetical protein